MAGLSLQGQKNTYDGVASTQITSEELGIAGIHTGNYQKVQSNYYDWRMMSASCAPTTISATNTT